MVACTETHGMGRGSAGQVLDTEGVKAWHKRREVLQWGIPGRRQDFVLATGLQSKLTLQLMQQRWLHRPGLVPIGLAGSGG